MTAVHQILVSAAPGDAITNAALDLRASLRQRGPSEVYAAFVHPDLAGEISLLEDFGRRSGPVGRLVLHVSIGEPRLRAFLAERDEPLAIVYHNISPAPAFRPWDPAFARLLDDGRRFLAGLAERTRVAVAVSEYNAGELRALGFRRVLVARLPVDAGRLRRTGPDRVMAARLAALDGPVILHVGQMLPHKRLDWLVMAYDALATHLVPEAHLVVVGAERLAPYADAMHRFIHELNLVRVQLLGWITQQALVSCYQAARVLATASEHEGFCAPLLEAMAFDVPVVARRFAAVPETLAGSGLLLDPADGPLVGAEALRAVLEDEPLRERLVAGERRRLAVLDAQSGRDALLAAVLDEA